MRSGSSAARTGDATKVASPSTQIKAAARRLDMRFVMDEPFACSQIAGPAMSIVRRLRAMLNMYPPNRLMAAIESSGNAASRRSGVPRYSRERIRRNRDSTQVGHRRSGATGTIRPEKGFQPVGSPLPHPSLMRGTHAGRASFYAAMRGDSR
jgi:hypothetical protein